MDVNVHPAKREVRFRDPAGVREAVVAAIRRTLESDRSSWQEQFRAPAVPEVPFVRRAETMAPSNDVAQPNFPVETREPAVTDDDSRLTRSAARSRNINSGSLAS